MNYKQAYKLAHVVKKTTERSVIFVQIIDNGSPTKLLSRYAKLKYFMQRLQFHRNRYK